MNTPQHAGRARRSLPGGTPATMTAGATHGNQRQAPSVLNTHDARTRAFESSRVAHIGHCFKQGRCTRMAALTLQCRACISAL